MFVKTESVENIFSINMYSFRRRRNSELIEAFKMLDVDGDGKVPLNVHINIKQIVSYKKIFIRRYMIR